MENFVAISQVTPASRVRERAVIREMLRYNLTVVAIGIDAASRSNIEGDPQSRQAIEAFPKAARLAAAAERTMAIGAKEKRSPSLVLIEQGRNRMN
ncbi:MAG: hypothetical protein WBD27_04960 [Pyrinomonadaceae bacterium]